MIVAICPEANQQLDAIYENKGIYKGKNFSHQFIIWNNEFYRYVNTKMINQSHILEHGWYKIGNIGVLEYRCVNTQDNVLFEILEFYFSKLPYSTQKSKKKKYTDAGYGYKIVQSFPDETYAILTPQKKYLTNFAFDDIIGFHHSIDDYNKVYAVGFIKDRVYAIYPNSDIEVLPYSKEEYLKIKHRYDESIKFYNMIIRESKIDNIIKETLHKYIYENRA